MQGLIEGLLQVVGTFGTGFYVAISPCLFPLLPMVLIRSLQSENSRGRSGLVTLSLVSGIMFSLVVFAFISSLIGLLLIQYHSIIQAVIGAIIAFLGLLMIFERFREVLGLHSEDTWEAIRKRYRELASQYHPDKVNHLGNKLKEVAEREMKEINEAYKFFRKKYEK